MPRISEFFGIVIYMYWLDTQQHFVPHFHARYAGEEAVFDLDGHLITGTASKRIQRLIREWAVERQSELRYAWEQAANGREIPWVTPIN